MPASVKIWSWLVYFKNKILQKGDDVVFFNDDIDLDGIDSDIFTCLSNDIGFVTIDLNNIT